MSPKEEVTQLFDNHQKGRLSSEEMQAFEDRMENDSVFAKSYQDHIQNVRIIKSIGIRDEMTEIMEKATLSTRSFKTRSLIPIGIAAALALTLLFLPRKSVDNHSLFEEYFTPYPNAITDRNSTGSFHDAMEYYTNQLYNASIKEFESLASNDTTRFYKGVSHLAIEEPQKALAEFRNISSNSMFQESVVWYKTLSFLLLNQTDSLHVNLKKIKIGSTHHKKSLEVIKELKSQK